MYSLLAETAWRAIAPGVCVALAATVLSLALARWYDRVPRRVLAVFALALAAFYGRVLVGGDVLLPLDNLRGDPPFEALPPAEPHGNLLQGDLIHLVEPLRSEVRRSVAAGAWPLWAPRLGAGEPLLANPQAQVLQPLTALGLAVAFVADPAGAPGAVAALRTFVALVFAFLLLRRLGAGSGPALAGALAYGLGGFLQLWLGWPLANSAAWLPAVLYGVLRTVEEGGRRDRGLLTLALFGLLTAGHPETIALSLALAGGLVALRVAGRPVPPDGRPRASRRALSGAAAALGVALLLAAPALLPFAAHLPETLRWSRVTGGGGGVRSGPAAPAETGTSASPAVPATRLVQVAAPNALGNSRYLGYWGVANSNEDAGGFVGTATLLAALLALPLALPRRSAPPVAHERAALALAAACLLLLALPGPGGAGLTGRLALPLDLALAVLAAATLERFRRGAVPRWVVRGALPAAALLLAAAYIAIVPAFADPSDPSHLDLLRTGWRHWHLRFLVGAAVTLFACGALFREKAAGRAGRLARRLVGARAPLRELAVLAIALAVGAELWLAHAPVNPPMPRALHFPATPVLQGIGGALRGPAPVRIAAGGRVFLPDLAALYGLGDARVYDPMAPARYLRLLEPGIERWTGEIPLLGPEGSDGGERARLYDRLGIAWWLSAPDVPCPSGTVPAALAVEDAGARLCRRPDALPLVRAAASPPVRVAAPNQVAAAPAGDRWRIERAGEAAPWRVETAVWAAPGWRVVASGSGGAVRIDPSPDVPLLAADLPAGSGRADLLYRPAPFVAGCLLCALGLALGLAWTARAPGQRTGAPLPSDRGRLPA